MSMELYVLSRTPLASIAAWQSAIDADGFALRLEDDRPLPALSGCLPAQFGGARCAFECDHFDIEEMRGEIPDLDPDRRYACLLAFRFGDPTSTIAAYLAAASYARATGGIVYDCEEGAAISPQRAAEVAQEIERSLPAIQAAIEAAVARMRDERPN